MNAEGYRPIPVAYRNGSPVRLSEVANVYDGVENPRNGELVQRHAGHLSRDRPSAGHQHGAGRRRDQGAAAAAAGAAAGVAGPRYPQRSLGLDPGVGRRRQVHAAVDGVPRRARDFPLPAESLRDDHPEPRAAVLDRRHVRGDVGARLQPRQPFADGADAVCRLRRRRRDRHAGEHRPAHGDGKAAHAGGVRRVEGDRVHDSSR